MLEGLLVFGMLFGAIAMSVEVLMRSEIQYWDEEHQNNQDIEETY